MGGGHLHNQKHATMAAFTVPIGSHHGVCVKPWVALLVGGSLPIPGRDTDTQTARRLWEWQHRPMPL